MDIVAQCEGLVATIECKKTETNVVTFLLPTQPKQFIAGTSNFVWVRRINDSTQRLAVSAGEVSIPPETSEAKFAVVANDSKNSNSRLIEADVQILLKGTIEYAGRSRSIRGLARTGPIVPILVTNAKLYIDEFDTSKVSTESGSLAAEFHNVSPVQFIRFRKAFVTHRSVELDEQTVFVVNADSLPKLLAELATARPSYPHENQWVNLDAR